MEYPKINSVFERDERGRFTDRYACPEFEYLAHNPWTWTEKVDGTNLRIYPRIVNGTVQRGDEHTWIRGRTDNAQLHPKLLTAVIDLVRGAPLETWVTDNGLTGDVVLYGEGYGAGIQKGGQYRPDPGFVLFDVNVDGWWLRRPDVVEVADSLGLDVVPIVGHATLAEAVTWMKAMATGDADMFKSQWEGARPEGVVGRPQTDLWDRKGQRVTTKLKFRDFR